MQLQPLGPLPVWCESCWVGLFPVREDGKPEPEHKEPDALTESLAQAEVALSTIVGQRAMKNLNQVLLGGWQACAADRADERADRSSGVETRRSCGMPSRRGSWSLSSLLTLLEEAS